MCTRKGSPKLHFSLSQPIAFYLFLCLRQRLSLQTLLSLRYQRMRFQPEWDQFLLFLSLCRIKQRLQCTVTAVTSANRLTIPQLPIRQQIFQIETIGGTVPVHVVSMKSNTEQMLPENQDVTDSETPYINTEPAITTPARTSTISTYTNTHPYHSVSLCTTPTCMVSRSSTIVLSKEITQGPVQMPRKGHPSIFAPQVTEVTSNLPKNSEVIYHPKPAHFIEPSILNISLSKASETFQDQQSDFLDLSTKQVDFQNFLGQRSRP